MASGFDDEEEEDEDELMTAKQPHEEDEEDSDYDPHRATPTADLVMAESSLHNASNAIHSKKSFSSLSDEAPPSTQSTSSQKTPTAQVAGNSAHHFALLNANLGGMVGAPEVGSFDPAYNHAHILDREGLERIRRDRYSYPAPPLHKIPQDYLTTHYKLQHRLGRGSFADVFKISTPPSTTTTTTTTPQPSYYALKKTRTQITGPKDRRFQLQELIIHMHLPTTSPHIISLHAAWEQYACLYMVLEYCPHGTLASYVERVGDVEEFVVWGVLGQLARGLEAVHAAGVVHMDLKPGNVLIGDGGVLKIGDFGLGLIIFEISTNIILPENGSHWQKLRRHDFSECSKQLNRVSPPLVELIKGMLHPSPRERLGLDTVLGHPFVIAILEGPGGLFG
ncbi:hypothetical protein HDU99_004328 [Rhizoclosmatium hyalinum]|nr:hypothetical protein HDU99_004328 [Rhizoclosmatium hyalinum]